MDVSLVFREAVKADLPAVLRLYAQPDLDDGQMLPLSKAEALFDRLGRYPNYTLRLAVVQGQVVGVFSLLIMDNLAHLGAPSAVIEDVAVDSQWQGQGIGRKLMHYGLQICRDHGCYKVSLSSHLKRDRAHAFYESLGFDRHGYSFQVPLGPTPQP
ncbi:GNAT family N-acetyltransferase [filamentous cyanobacterium CCP5]|nr:GNAT family N-acetyltransferase [filamentous cyanobacterium CCP5]